MAFQNSNNQNFKPKVPFADFCEVVSIDSINPDDLSDYDKELGMKFQLVVLVRPSQRFGDKSFPEIAHYSVKVASSEGLKVGDSILVKGSHSEGKRWISSATVKPLKK